MTKSFLNGFVILFLSIIICADLSGQQSTLLSDSTFPASERFQNKGFIRGRLAELKTNTPVCFADIFISNKTSFTKSNSKGEFILGPFEFPATLRIRKFGFKEETVIINNPVNPVLISLAPLEVHKSASVHLPIQQ